MCCKVELKTTPSEDRGKKRRKGRGANLVKSVKLEDHKMANKIQAIPKAANPIIIRDNKMIDLNKQIQIQIQMTTNQMR